MSKIRLRYYDCDEILEYLDGAYFHPSREKEFPSLEIKYAAQCALLRLWNMFLIEIYEDIYYNQDIRRIVYEDMLPEHLDNAVQICVSLGKTNDLEFFARMIFFQVVLQTAEYEAILKSTIVYPCRIQLNMLAEVGT